MRITITAAATAVLAIATIATTASGAQAASPSDATTEQMVAQVRAAAAHLKTAEDAIAAGYIPLGECVEGPDGAMGVHYLNPALVHPGVVDPSYPPMLTYGTSASGRTELWAAEFYEPDLGQPTPTFGSQPFDGPMPGHSPGMPTHYDLHVWVGAHNPAGLFADFNPAVHC
ncbi:hypothetical protein [Microbacterium xylanilyticum]